MVVYFCGSVASLLMVSSVFIKIQKGMLIDGINQQISILFCCIFYSYKSKTSQFVFQCPLDHPTHSSSSFTLLKSMSCSWRSQVVKNHSSESHTSCTMHSTWLSFDRQLTPASEMTLEGGRCLSSVCAGRPESLRQWRAPRM